MLAKTTSRTARIEGKIGRRRPPLKRGCMPNGMGKQLIGRA